MVGEEQRRGERLSLCLALLAALLACGFLARIVHRTEWAMDADEAVHAIEALRLEDSLARGALGEFLREAWTPERWAPPVNPHVRWYPPVHALATVPFLALLGPSDFSARLPSVFFLFGTALLFHALGRRLAPRTPAVSGLLATLFLLASPNVLTFSAQSLIEPASLFFTFLALLLYLGSLERGHPPGRAALAGLALAVAMLTKYDHGGLFALCLGLAELVRVRGRIARLLPGGAVLFLLPLLLIAAWFATGDKLDALKDSMAHPFAGSSRLVFLDFILTWVLEYGSSLALGGLFVLALCLGWRRADPGVRAVWIWAVLTALFLGVRSRFHFRYNLIEAPATALLAAVLLPSWVERLARSLRAPWPALRSTAAAVAGALLLGTGAAVAVAPDAAFEALRGPFAWIYGLRADHFGMSLEPGAYVDFFAREQRALAIYLGGSLAALGFGLAVLGAGALVLRAQPGERGLAASLVWTALAIAAVPGAVRLYARLPEMVEWELECHPQTRAAQDYVASIVGADPLPARILLGGGWDQLTNNSLRWYLLTRGGLGARFDEVQVVGDMIGSLVFPPEARIRYWAELLAKAGASELPEHVVLVRPDPERFLYQVRIGPEVGLYADVLAARGGYRLAGEASFPALQARVEVWRRAGEPGPPLSDVETLLERHSVAEGTPAYGSRVLIGEGGWTIPDESPRHFLRRDEARGQGIRPGSARW